MTFQDPELQAALANADSAPEAQLLESWKAYKKGFQQGIALFNAKPKKGIAFLQVIIFPCYFFCTFTAQNRTTTFLRGKSVLYLYI